MGSATTLNGVSQLQRRWAILPVTMVLMALGIPYLWTRLPLIAFAMDSALSLVCHQRPDRSFWIFGAPVAVCARCLGIYLGATLGLMLRGSRRIAMRLLVMAAFVNLLDAVTEAAGLHGNWITARFLLGFTLGTAGALLISSSIQTSATLLSNQAAHRLDSTN